MTESKRKDRKNMNTWLSILAVLVSFGAFGVSIYEAGIMREQQEIMYQEQQLMLEQQKASVWPYLESDISYAYQPDGSSIIYKLKNKGVGPAKIKESNLSLKDSIVADYNQILEVITGLLPEDLGGKVNFSFRPPSGVLSPEEETVWLNITLPRFEGDMGILGNFLFQFEICYCSIYDDCWTLLSKSEEPVEGCQAFEKK
ncbi:MAG: hypothetical protein AAF806_11505 [Bacteroidota bacterium]